MAVAAEAAVAAAVTLMVQDMDALHELHSVVDHRKGCWQQYFRLREVEGNQDSLGTHPSEDAPVERLSIERNPDC